VVTQLLRPSLQPGPVGKRCDQQGLQELAAQSILGQGHSPLLSQLHRAGQRAPLHSQPIQVIQLLFWPHDGEITTFMLVRAG